VEPTQLTPEEMQAICRLLIDGLTEKQARQIIANSKIAQQANQAVRCSVRSSVHEQPDNAEDRDQNSRPGNNPFDTNFW